MDFETKYELFNRAWGAIKAKYPSGMQSVDSKFMSAFERTSNTYVPSRGRFESYAYYIIKSKFMESYRAYRGVDQFEDGCDVSDNWAGVRKIETARLSKEIEEAALRALAPASLDIFLRMYIQGQEPRQIGIELGITKQAVSKSNSRAIKAIKEALNVR